MLADNFTPGLRQGDVCLVDQFPVWNIAEVAVTTRANGSVELALPNLANAQGLQDRPGHLVVVLTHDCDLENTRNRAGVLLAPLVRLNTRQPGFEDIIKSGAPVSSDENSVEWSFLSGYPIPVAGAESGWAIADFSRATTMAPAGQAVSRLIASKVWEMTDEERDLFRSKFASYFNRSGDSE
jgi:hypothetical protein